MAFYSEVSPGGTLPDTQRPVVIINAATSVRCRHYSRFADYLFANDFDVITYDYRGIGESRPASLKGLKASWSDWGALDFEAMLKRAQREFPNQPIDVVGHSFGGCAGGPGRRDGYPPPGDRWRAIRVLARLCARSSLADAGQVACGDAADHHDLRLLSRQAPRLAGRHARRRGP
jgi:hypothetical protein